ncbi:MAG: zinc ribbon domain-containing protein [Gammaproteobacteria bacterium]|nr:zinc ribbon domain-containing protein [Gammaproteobacteria bacterium]
MPIYEYICTSCDNNHEALQKLSDDPLLDCPACGQSALKKKLSAPGFRLSGSGWYETDFKSDKQRNLADSASKKEPDSKPEKTAEKKEPGKNKDAAA